MRRRITACILAVLLCGWTHGAPSGVTTFSALKIGGGGFITGIDIAADGTKVVRTDTFGGYWLNSTNGLWQQIVTSSSLPSNDPNILSPQGVYEIRIAPSNTNRFWMNFSGNVYISNNRGASWSKTAFTQDTNLDSNGNYRLMGPFMAVDPANADICYIGTETGLSVTTDAGATWTSVASVPAPTVSGPNVIIAFDSTSAVVGGKTQGIYASSYGHGVYHSTNGSTFSITTGTPITHSHITVDQTGIVWLVDDGLSLGGRGGLNKFASGSWSSIFASSSDLHTVMVDPANASNVYAGQANGGLQGSTNGGSTWFSLNSFTRSSPTIPWLATTSEGFMANGDMKFDPSGSNLLYFAEGIGVWTTNPPSSSTAFVWTSKTASIEQLVSNQVISPPGGSVIVAVWDRSGFQITDPTTYTAVQAMASQFSHGWSIDYAPPSPSTIVLLSNVPFGLNTSGFSTDGGATWNVFPTAPTGEPGDAGGYIAACTSTNFVWIPTDQGASTNTSPWWTTNAGTTWTQASVPGVPNTGGTGWKQNFFDNGQYLTVDKVTSNTLYAFNTISGTFKSSDCGQNWSLQSSTVVFRNDLNGMTKAVPGNAGHLFIAAGSANPPHPDANHRFYRSTDGGVTWTQIPNFLEVLAFGFGKAKPGGGGYPAIYVAGWLSGVYGIYRSDDNAATWIFLTDYPMGVFSTVKAMEGDSNIYGTVYVGFAGAAFAKGKINFLLKHDLNPANDNTPMWLNEVA